MTINENKEIFAEVRFEDLKAGNTFAIEHGSSGYIYAIKTTRTFATTLSIDLKDGSSIWINPDDLVIPVEIIGDVKWPIGFFKRK